MTNMGLLGLAFQLLTILGVERFQSYYLATISLTSLMSLNEEQYPMRRTHTLPGRKPF